MPKSYKLKKAAVDFIKRCHKEGLSTKAIRSEVQKKFGIEVTESAIYYRIHGSKKCPKTVLEKGSSLKNQAPLYVKAAALFLVRHKNFNKEELRKYLSKRGFKLGKTVLSELFWLPDDQEMVKKIRHEVFEWPAEAQFPAPWGNQTQEPLPESKPKKEVLKTKDRSTEERLKRLHIKEIELEIENLKFALWKDGIETGKEFRT